MIPKSDKLRLVFTTDVNGTTTPENTFAELVRPDGLADDMAGLMGRYTTGQCSFTEVLEPMARMTRFVDRKRLENYAARMPLFEGVEKTFSRLLDSDGVDALLALSTTGFAGLMALVNFMRHEGKLKVAASPVLTELLSDSERRCLVHDILKEEDKVAVLDKLVQIHGPAPGLVFHVGDTLGDLPGLVHAARLGGVGIAFRPNTPLKNRIRNLEPGVRKSIRMVEPAANEMVDYGAVLRIIQHQLKKTGNLHSP